MWLMRTNQPGIIVKSKHEFGQPIFFIDPDYNIRKCSKRVKSILEYTDESELVGQKCHQLFYRSDEPCRFCPVSRAVLLKTVVEQKIESDSMNDNAAFRTAIATPIQDESGEVQHLVVACLGENFSIPQNEKRSEPPTVKSADSPFSNGCILLDRDMSIILFNNDIKRLVDHEGSDIIGRNLFTIVPFYNRPDIRNRIEDFMFQNEKIKIEFETVDAGGGAARIKHVVEKMDGHGHLDAVLLRSTRVETKSFDDKKALKEQLKILSQFAGRMAHDVKNALALISTNADFIYSEAPETDMTGAKNNIAQYAEIIQKHVKQIVGIVEHANSLKVHNWDTTAESDLAQLLNRVVTITQLSKPYISHNVSLKINGAMPRIITSELYLERALTELVKSILQSAEQDSSLKINVSHEPARDEFFITFVFRQQSNLFSELDAKLKQFYVAKKQWDPEMLGLLIAYAAVLIQDGSMQTTLLDTGEFQLRLSLPRAPKLHK
jgi:nitrogen-specific signal transduction histidine kinase